MDYFKRISVVFHTAWLTQLLLFALFSGSHSLDVKGELHKDVLLPCVVDYKDKFDYNALVVNWQRPENDAVVHSFFYGSSQPNYTDAHYKGRTEIFNEVLPNGNASLLLRNLTESDAGMYICHVILKQSSGFLIQNVNLTIYDVPVAERKNTTWILILALLASFVVLSAVLLVRQLSVWCYKSRKDEEKDEDVPVAKRKNTTPILFVASLTLIMVLTMAAAVLLVWHYKTRTGEEKDKAVPVAEWETTTWILIVALLAMLVAMAMVAVLLVQHYKTRKRKAKDKGQFQLQTRRTYADHTLF